MILIGENINIMSQTIGPAMKEHRAEPVLEMASRQNKTTVDYLDLNIGPAKKSGAELMSWLVQTVQTVSDKLLSLDTTNPDAIEAGQKL